MGGLLRFVALLSLYSATQSFTPRTRLVFQPAASRTGSRQQQHFRLPYVLGRRSTRRATECTVSSARRARPSLSWEGDDIRWTSRLSRRIRRASVAAFRTGPVRSTLVAINMLVFLLQVTLSVRSIRTQFPEHWPSGAFAIIYDSLIGTTKPGPLTLHWGAIPGHPSLRREPYRYLTSGFLHGGIVHLLANMDALRRLPSWIETGLGGRLLVTTYLLSTVAGTLAPQVTPSSFCLGASSGIAGLQGLLWVSMVRMKYPQTLFHMCRSLGVLFLYGMCFANTSHAAHVAAFACGTCIAVLFGPRYRSSYALRRKWSVQIDPVTKDYRAAMGFGVLPTESLLPLSVLWIGVILVVWTAGPLRAIPHALLQEILRLRSMMGIIQ